MTNWQVMKMGTISILDNMKTIDYLFKEGREKTACHTLGKLGYKIEHLWEYGLCELDQMREIKHLVKLWAEKKYRKGYLV